MTLIYVTKKNVFGVLRLWSSCTFILCMFTCNGVVINTTNEYYKLGENTTLTSLKRFS